MKKMINYDKVGGKEIGSNVMKKEREGRRGGGEGEGRKERLGE